MVVSQFRDRIFGRSDVNLEVSNHLVQDLSEKKHHTDNKPSIKSASGSQLPFGQSGSFCRSIYIFCSFSWLKEYPIDLKTLV